mgnify:CR=1 FL=1
MLIANKIIPSRSINQLGLFLLKLNWYFSDVAAEKTEKALIAGIEHFDQTKLKHTETQEKNPLPNKDGKPKPCYMQEVNNSCSAIFNTSFK